MPPSGFSTAHTSGIEQFLNNCISDLINENDGIRSPKEAIARELRHIEQDQKENKRSASAAAVLALAKDCYTRIAKQMKQTDPWDFRAMGQMSGFIVEEICEEILAIKVAEGV